MLSEFDFKIAHPETFRELCINGTLFLRYFFSEKEHPFELFTDYNSIVLTVKGQPKFDFEDKSKHVKPGSAIFIKKASYKQIHITNSKWEVIAFYFKDDFLHHIFEEIRTFLPFKNLPPVSDDFLLNLKINEVTRAFFYSIIPYFTQKTTPGSPILQLKFKELLFNILSNPENADFLTFVNNSQDNHKPLLRDVMENHFTHHLTVGEYARLSDRSVSSFKREFQKQYKISPGRWLTGKRLKYAKLLLETSEKNISEITFDSGFTNVSHFCRIFKEAYGESPLCYRKLKAS